MDYQDEVVRRATTKGLAKKRIYVKKGDAILWHPLAPHGGAPIENPSRTRLSLVLHTILKGVPVFLMDVFSILHDEFGKTHSGLTQCLRVVTSRKQGQCQSGMESNTTLNL